MNPIAPNLQYPYDVFQGTLGQLFICSPHGEYLRLRTPYLYPDGDVIDLFLKVNENGNGGSVTDVGETIRWLKGQTVSPKRTPRQTAMIADICATHGVEFFKGSLVGRYANDRELADAVNRVAQAAIRVSDLSFSFRNRALESVVEEVEDFLIEQKIDFEKAPRLPGRSGRIWMPSFHTRTPAISSLVYVLATGSRSVAKAVSNQAVAAWYDLSNLRVGPNPLQFVSVFDDTSDVWSSEDFELVSSLSRVARWSDPQEFGQILKAAA